jgi:hypothetical protein
MTFALALALGDYLNTLAESMGTCGQISNVKLVTSKPKREIGDGSRFPSCPLLAKQPSLSFPLPSSLKLHQPPCPATLKKRP